VPAYRHPQRISRRLLQLKPIRRSRDILQKHAACIFLLVIGSGHSSPGLSMMSRTASPIRELGGWSIQPPPYVCPGRIEADKIKREDSPPSTHLPGAGRAAAALSTPGR
jgi:hypothetical protein